ncbi:helix-turn-helix domain-containing protein [Adhaeribacter pallidiroseus]|uniref:HTH cro/C1-type domain-containing protein n=1 Tax=Adhaeribacter pallidiroseus TaxID=2072847 RepID=A0A369Q1H8_9BACT|nr:helix-turn-helix transcriptional regulator [Adhaeribacter pallidiroseus]RDC58781.1 hypothetical protein AHMF7616_05215 [Adhaeribacter pallidiroseus]
MQERSFGSVLRELRQAKKISQEAFAFQVNLDRSYISLLERDLRVPTLHTLFKIAAILEIRPEEVIARMQVDLSRYQPPLDAATGT